VITGGGENVFQGKLSSISLDVASDLIEAMGTKEIKDVGNFRIVEGLTATGAPIRIITVGCDEALLME
jgi:hypothetical protein